MWNRDKRVLAILLTVFIGNVSFSSTLLGIVTGVNFVFVFQAIIAHSCKGFTIISVPPEMRLPGGTGCAVSGPEGHFWLTFVTGLTFESPYYCLPYITLSNFLFCLVIVVALTLIRAIMHSRAGFAKRDTPLATHLYQTGVLYFLLVGTVMGFMSVTALTPVRESPIIRIC